MCFWNRFLVVLLCSIGYVSLNFCPNGNPPQSAPKDESWRIYMESYKEKNNLTVRISSGNKVTCNGKEIPLDFGQIKTIVTIGDELFINGTQVNKSYYQETLPLKEFQGGHCIIM